MTVTRVGATRPSLTLVPASPQTKKRNDSLELLSREQAEEELRESNASIGLHYMCQDCEDSPDGFMPTLAGSSGEIYKGWIDIYHYKKQTGYDKLTFGSPVKCPSCQTRRSEDYKDEHMFQSWEGEPVQRKTIEKIAPHLVDVATTPLERSTFIVGKSGELKTVIAKYWHNRIIKKTGYAGNIVWITEIELADKLRNSESYLSYRENLERRKIDYLFLDDIFLPQVWKNRGMQGHYSQNLYLGIWDFWDWIYENKHKLTVVATSNYEPQEALPDEQEFVPIIRRFNKIFGEKDKWLRLHDK